MAEPRRILVTGGAGFVGSALARHLIAATDCQVLVIDKLSYAGDLRSLEGLKDDPRFSFLKADVCDGAAVRAAIGGFRPDVITHLAAESHVDRSIDGPAAFVETNVVGTFSLLTQALDYFRELEGPARARFRFHHTSTDEVFGALGEHGAFTETSAYDPRSPYSATKAASDHLVRAWGHTYGLPVIVTNCSNNYGPFQLPEKLIPLMIAKCLAGESLPVYGDGRHVRDWLYVGDHVKALTRIFEDGAPGETYVIGARNEQTNLAVVHRLCDILDRIRPRPDGGPYRTQITHVSDRPGHDHRYAIDPARLEQALGWRPLETFASGLGKTVRWYLDHESWWRPGLGGPQAGRRLGLSLA